MFFAIILAATYLGYLPKVKLADGLVASGFTATIPFLMAVGVIFFWLGNTIRILNNYLGGACLLPLIGASFMNYMGWVPTELVKGTQVLMRGGFQDAYIIRAVISVWQLFTFYKYVACFFGLIFFDNTSESKYQISEESVL